MQSRFVLIIAGIATGFVACAGDPTEGTSWQGLSEYGDGDTSPPPDAGVPSQAMTIAVDIPDADPLLAYLQSAPGPVDVGRLELDSPAVEALREAGVALIVPLVSQGELIGTLNLFLSP